MNESKNNLVIVGGGIVGLSLLLSLRDFADKFSSITVYDAPDFFPTCALNSTAIVAARGVSSGHSDLGDLLVCGFKSFENHFRADAPLGVQMIKQFTGSSSKQDQFLKRYPDAQINDKAGSIGLNSCFLLSEETAYQITPSVYLDWIRTEVSKKLPVVFKNELFLEGDADSRIVFCGGIANQVWDSTLKVRPAQGSYFKFNDVDFGGSSFSLTLEGKNLIYHHGDRTLLIGSTTAELNHYLAPLDELIDIYNYLDTQVDLTLPDVRLGTVLVGIREKAPKRRPYIESNRIGGLYKNGYMAGLEVTKRWCREFLS